MEIPDEVLLYMCDISDISYTKYFRLINKVMNNHVDIYYKIYKIINLINDHYSTKNLKWMHQTGLIIHTNKLKNKINIDKKLLIKNLNLIKDEHLCTYTNQYFHYIIVTTHSVILNLL